MDLLASLRRRTLALLARLSAAGALSPDLDAGRSSVVPAPVGARHDIVLDAALVHARDVAAAGAGPAWLARMLAAEASAWPEVEAAEVAGPGLIEVTLRPAARFKVVAEILRRGAATGAAKEAPRRSGRRDADGLAQARADVLAEVLSSLAAASGCAQHPPAGGPPRCGPVVVVRRGAPRGEACRCARLPGHADVIAAVGADAFRIEVTSRRPDALLRLDLDALGERARSNAAFWLPYVHARSRTLLRRRALATPHLDLGPAGLARADLGALTGPDDLALMRLLVLHGHAVSRAASTGLPHLFHVHLRSLADGVHAQWSGSKDQPQLRFVNEQRRYSTEARLALVTASTLVLGSGLGILGVAAPEEMP